MNPYDAPDVDRIDRLAKRVKGLEQRVDALTSTCTVLGVGLIALALATLKVALN